VNVFKLNAPYENHFIFEVTLVSSNLGKVVFPSWCNNQHEVPCVVSVDFFYQKTKVLSSV